MNILQLIINNFNNFRILRLPIQGKFRKYIHSTHIIKFQHNLPQTVHLKSGNNYKDYKLL